MTSTNSASLLRDEAARASIRSDLDTNLFVSAGAGSGKTTALVERLIALVARGTTIDHVAAITFTDKAADELRHRIRTELGRQANLAPDPVARRRFTTALDDLDQAAFCTLHAFAQRILTTFPVEAGLPPAIGVLDEIASEADFDQRWQAFYDDLASRPELDRVMTLALELGITHDHVRAVAEQLEDNWDRVRVPERTPPEPPTVDVTPLVDTAEALLAACVQVGPSDPLARMLSDWLPGWRDNIEEADDELALLDLLLGAEPPKLGSRGRTAWAATELGGAKDARDAAKGLVTRDQAGGALARVLGAVIEPLLARLSAEIARFTLVEAERRRRSGQLTFHDLLVLCRQLVEDEVHGPRVREELAERYEAILVDEYQDTDPLQLDIVLAIATPPGGAAPRRGQLFFVGDPKQSLYRFRRADINLFLRTPERTGAAGLSLTTNFRSTPAILAWLNHVFGRLIQRAVTDDGTTLAQPAFEALDAQPAPTLRGASVGLLGVDPHPKGTLVGALRAQEAAEVAAAVRTVVTEGWTVRQPGHDAPVPARWRDIAVLIPARTVLGQLETALKEACIPYRLDTGSLVYASDEVRALLLALRAVEDPSDHLAVVSALRTSLYGCSDVDLYRWCRQRGGHWSPHAPAPDRLDGVDRVWDAMADLRGRLANRAWSTPSEQLESLVRERRVLETALATPGGLDAWHRVRFVIEQARAWSDTGGRFLRDYLDWTRRQTALTGRVAETPLDDADPGADGDEAGVAGALVADDAVRVLTIHGAKGLEFPIALVCGLSSPPGKRQRGVQVSWGVDGQVVRLRADLAQAGFDVHRAIDEQMDTFERTRLLYVACTRARDHLLVSLHRTDGGPATGARVLAECVTAADDIAALVPVQQEIDTAPAPAPIPIAAGPAPTLRLQDLGVWRAGRRAVLASAREPGSVSATALAAGALATESVPGADDEDRFEELAGAESPDDVEPGLAKRPVDLDLPAWRKGRYGTSIGRAVHAVLQVVDLATGDGIEAMAKAQAAAEGIEGEQARIAELARSALTAPAVQAAARSEHWREVYVGVPVGDRVLEGYLDLLYRSPDGLVVVDHKTDQVTTDDDVTAKLAAYRLQLAAYALAVERATGEVVVDARLVFCRRGRAREEAVPDLRAAVEEVERVLTSA